MSYILEGATMQSTSSPWTITIFVGDKTKATPATDKAVWWRLSPREFASPEEAQYWLAENAERFVRERVVAVRLLQIVAHYAPHCVAFFPAVDATTVKTITEQRPATTSPYDGTSGDEWKIDNGGAE